MLLSRLMLEHLLSWGGPLCMDGEVVADGASSHTASKLTNLCVIAEWRKVTHMPANQQSSQTSSIAFKRSTERQHGPSKKFLPEKRLSNSKAATLIKVARATYGARVVDQICPERKPTVAMGYMKKSLFTSTCGKIRTKEHTIIPCRLSLRRNRKIHAKTHMSTGRCQIDSCCIIFLSRIYIWTSPVWEWSKHCLRRVITISRANQIE